MNLRQLFDLSLIRRARETALEWAGSEYTFAEIDARSNRMANALKARGLSHGDRLCVYLANRLELIDLYLASIKLGVIFVPVNILYRDREITHILSDADPKLFVTDAERTGRSSVPLSAVTVDLAELNALAAGQPSTLDVLPIDGDAPAALVYTSGTTGTSKGAIITHNNLAANGLNLIACWQITAADRFLLALPLFHVHALGNGLHCWLISGCRMRLLERFEHQTAAATMLEFQPTLFFGVPTMYVRLLETPAAEALKIGSKMRLFVSGSAPLPAQVMEDFRERFGHTILERYGMTETMMNLSNPYVGERRPGSVGFALPGISCRILDAEGHDVSDGETGEVYLKGPNIFTGYWRREDATKAAFGDGTNTAGWFKTGDIAQRASDGYITLCGRRSDLIISGGFNIYPREIEEFLMEQPGVAEAAVAAQPDRVRGEIPVAYVVASARADGGTLDCAALDAVCRENSRRSSVHAVLWLSKRCRVTRWARCKNICSPLSPFCRKTILMNVLMVASEAAPFVKTGGLADVLGALPPALARLGENVAVVLPRYRTAELPVAKPSAGTTRGPIPIAVGPHEYTAMIERVERGGVRYFFVDCPPLYDRAGIYNVVGVDFPDNHIRFAALAQASIAIARYFFPTDVFHAHDWQGGLVGAYLRTNFATDPTFFGTRTAFTIHNIGYQGIFPASTVPDLGLDPAQFQPEGFEFFGQVSFMKAGLVWADAITTVSPTYAREIQTPTFGFGLEGVLATRADKLTGILNGVDYEEWDPATDPLLPTPYSAQHLSGKRGCKRALLQEMGFPYATEQDLARPLIGIVSRFAQQKGMELVLELGAWLEAQDAALVALGSGEAAIEKGFLELAAAYPDRFAARIGYDNGLAHRIEGGADLFLMPSRYEPCGLNQIYSLRYGTVPVVRATGGLDDTVDESTGFKFKDATGLALAEALKEALAAYRQRDSWVARMRRGMAKDFSWDASAKLYRDLYRAL